MSTKTDKVPRFGDVGFRVIPPAIIDQDGRPRDISTATSIQVFALRPFSGVQTTWDAELATDGADGLVVRVTEEGDLDESDGTWTVQARVVLADGTKFHGPFGRMRVRANLSGGTGTSPLPTNLHGPNHSPGAEDPIPGISDVVPGLVTDLASHVADTDNPHSTAVLDVLRGAAPADSFVIVGATTLGTITLSQLVQALSFPSGVRASPMARSTFLSDRTVQSVHHWSQQHRQGTDAGTVTIPDTLGPVHITRYVQEGAGGSIAFAASGTMQIVRGADTVLHEGEGAWLIVDSATRCRIIPDRPRMEAGTITASETHSPQHHGQLRTYAGSGAAVVTFEPGRAMDATAYVRAGDGALTFVAGAGMEPLIIPDGLAAEVVADGRVVATYETATRVRLEGWLAEAP